jgi:hypothetical protein
MKNFAIVILLAACLALGAFAFFQQKQIAQTKIQLTAAQTQLAGAQNELQKNAEAADYFSREVKKSKVLQDVLAETSKQADEKSNQVAQLQQSLAATKTNSPLSGLSKMFKDPAMRDMIKAQQKAAIGPMIQKQYAALFQQLNLTPDQSATLKDLLTKKMLVGADAGMSMLDDSLDAAQRADLSKQIKTQTDDYDSQIKDFLGDDNYKSFQAYEKTTPDRMTVGQFSDQLSGGATAMTPDQQSQLIQAMSTARNNFKWTTDYNNQNPANGDYASMFTDDKLNQFTQEKEQFDTQFLENAKQILTPDQLTAFQQFQNSQRELQLAGMKMAAQMFGKKSQ